MSRQYFNNFPIVNYNGISLRNIMLKSTFIREILLSSSLYDYTVPEGERITTVAYDYYGSVDYAWLIMISNQLIDPYFQWPMTDREFESYITAKYGSVDAARGYYQGNSNGTISTNGSTVTGVGTEFAERFSIGDYVKANRSGTTTSDDYRKVTAIANNTSMTISSGYSTNLVANTFQTTKGIAEYALDPDDDTSFAISVETYIYAYTDPFFPISNYEKEFRLNEQRRDIKLVDRQFAPRIAVELEKSLNN